MGYNGSNRGRTNQGYKGWPKSKDRAWKGLTTGKFGIITALDKAVKASQNSGGYKSYNYPPHVSFSPSPVHNIVEVKIHELPIPSTLRKIEADEVRQTLQKYDAIIDEVVTHLTNYQALYNDCCRRIGRPVREYKPPRVPSRNYTSKDNSDLILMISSRICCMLELTSRIYGLMTKCVNANYTASMDRQLEQTKMNLASIKRKAESYQVADEDKLKK